MIVVAVHHLDVDSSLSHPPRNLTELARLILLQALHDHLSIGHDAYAGLLERFPRCDSVRKEEVRDTRPVVNENPSAFDADASASKGLAQPRQGAGPVFELNRQISHSVTFFSSSLNILAIEGDAHRRIPLNCLKLA